MFVPLRHLAWIALVLPATGCLNLGGRTTYVQENPESARRLSDLETRVSQLEQFGGIQETEAIPAASPPLRR